MIQNLFSKSNQTVSQQVLPFLFGMFLFIRWSDTRMELLSDRDSQSYLLSLSEDKDTILLSDLSVLCKNPTECSFVDRCVVLGSPYLIEHMREEALPFPLDHYFLDRSILIPVRETKFILFAESEGCLACSINLFNTHHLFGKGKGAHTPYNFYEARGKTGVMEKVSDVMELVTGSDLIERGSRRFPEEEEEEGEWIAEEEEVGMETSTNDDPQLLSSPTPPTPPTPPPSEDSQDGIPSKFLCPLSLSLFKDPVVAEDGMTYEKEWILRWFETSGKSPVTGLQLSSFRIFRNFYVRSEVREWLEDQKNASDKKNTPSPSSSGELPHSSTPLQLLHDWCVQKQKEVRALSTLLLDIGVQDVKVEGVDVSLDLLRSQCDAPLLPNMTNKEASPRGDEKGTPSQQGESGGGGGGGGVRFLGRSLRKRRVEKPKTGTSSSSYQAGSSSSSSPPLSNLEFADSSRQRYFSNY